MANDTTMKNGNQQKPAADEVVRTAATIAGPWDFSQIELMSVREVSRPQPGPLPEEKGKLRPALAKSNAFVARLWTMILAGAVAVVLVGCGPPGPRALVEGKRLIEQGQYAPAIDQLLTATRLMATNAQAWNYLGLAYHKAGQLDEAAGAYQKALKLDRDLVIVHYNLGCLLLEQNRPDKTEAARTELTAFTLQQGNSVAGWLKLGTAELRLRDAAGAEASFGKALKLNADEPEAWNGLGLVELQRNRQRDAAAYFSSALMKKSDYGPALLNLAVVSQTYLNNRPLALQKYQEYLALNPRPANWDAVNAVARQLEQELNGAAEHPAVNPTPVVTNAVRPASNVAVHPPPPATNVPRPASSNPPPPPAAEPEVKPEVVVMSTPTEPPARVAENAASANLPRAVASNSEQSVIPPPEEVEPPKPGFLQRINPFRREPRAVPSPTPLPEPVSPDANSDVTSSRTLPPARYTYISPPKPADGDRAAADRMFAQARQAEREHRMADAEALYRAATQADPDFFEAQSNLGLAAYQVGDMTQSLLAYETALAIKPSSFSTRFNFALALRKANYLQDAAQELERLLAANPGETSAHLAMVHLTLANLYAEQFHRPAAARPHYLKVLELDPQNSQATPIRYWLHENP